ncbi:MAG: hypothetical protein ACK5MW_05135 [Enterococcus sp.]
MKIIYYAQASLRYHRKKMMPYFLFTLLISLIADGLFILSNSLEFIYNQASEYSLLHQGTMNLTIFDNQLRLQLNQAAQLYHRSLGLLFLVFIIGSVLFFFRYLKNRSEFSYLKLLGISSIHWYLLILLEIILPFIVIILISCLFFICFQNGFQSLLEHIQLHFLQPFNLQHINDFQSQSTGLMVKLPNSSDVLLSLIHVSTRSWVHLVMDALQKTFIRIGLFYCLVIPLITYLSKRRSHYET